MDLFGGFGNDQFQSFNYYSLHPEEFSNPVKKKDYYYEPPLTRYPVRKVHRPRTNKPKDMDFNNSKFMNILMVILIIIIVIQWIYIFTANDTVVINNINIPKEKIES